MYQHGYYPSHMRGSDERFSPLTAGLIGVGLGYLGGGLLNHHHHHPSGYGPGHPGYGPGYGSGGGFGPGQGGYGPGFGGGFSPGQGYGGGPWQSPGYGDEFGYGPNQGFEPGYGSGFWGYGQESDSGYGFSNTTGNENTWYGPEQNNPEFDGWDSSGLFPGYPPRLY
ncbi:hypothetical protein [Salipaludibacillus daqingensis]|uniref:hypothetical protein n=1 Tax=Salipaludibacillus daqingensis TaxID=3041001 RepID=UPI002475FDD5|nr:hypothetical protein [Salipaludibacillus daqingensis]